MIGCRGVYVSSNSFFSRWFLKKLTDAEVENLENITQISRDCSHVYFMEADYFPSRPSEDSEPTNSSWNLPASLIFYSLLS
jgi:hypothetical protein